MKSTVIAIALLVISTGMFAQSSKIDEVFNKFQGKEGITSVIVTSDLLKLASDMETQDSALNILKNITSVRILSLEHASPQDVVAFENMIKEVQLNNFKELMIVKESKNDVRMLAQESQGHWNDFILIVTGGKNNALINVKGSITPKELHSLSKTMHVEGMACVNKLK